MTTSTIKIDCATCNRPVDEIRLATHADGSIAVVALCHGETERGELTPDDARLVRRLNGPGVRSEIRGVAFVPEPPEPPEPPKTVYDKTETAAAPAELPDDEWAAVRWAMGFVPANRRTDETPAWDVLCRLTGTPGSKG